MVCLQKRTAPDSEAKGHPESQKTTTSAHQAEIDKKPYSEKVIDARDDHYYHCCATIAAQAAQAKARLIWTVKEELKCLKLATRLFIPPMGQGW